MLTPTEETPGPRLGMARAQRSLPSGCVLPASTGKLLGSTATEQAGSGCRKRWSPLAACQLPAFLFLQSREGGRDMVGKQGRHQVTTTAKVLERDAGCSGGAVRLRELQALSHTCFPSVFCIANEAGRRWSLFS